MIKKTILTTICLLILYSIVLIIWGDRLASSNDYQNQWNKNKIKTESYFWEDNIPENVIVGTSLSARILEDKIPGFYKLSFDGLSVFDGLEVIKKRKKNPKVVFIETNLIYKEKAKEFSDTFSNNTVLEMKKFFLPSREKYKPIGIIGNKFINNAMSVKRQYNVNEISKINIKSKVNAHMLDERKREYSEIIDDKVMKRQLAELHRYIDYFEKNEVQIVFFEMPINYELMNSPRFKYIENQLLETFPKSKYRYIFPDVQFRPVTTDGHHLNLNESIYYSDYFFHEANKYLFGEISITKLNGFYPPENYNDFWCIWGKRRELEMYVQSTNEINAQIRGSLLIAKHPNNVKIFFNGKQIYSCSDIRNFEIQMAPVSINISKGLNTLKIECTEDAIIAGKVQKRNLTVAIKNFEIIDKKGISFFNMNPYL